jgi:hypothetical protein
MDLNLDLVVLTAVFAGDQGYSEYRVVPALLAPDENGLGGIQCVHGNSSGEGLEFLRQRSQRRNFKAC